MGQPHSRCPHPSASTGVRAGATGLARLGNMGGMGSREKAAGSSGGLAARGAHGLQQGLGVLCVVLDAPKMLGGHLCRPW